MQAVGGGVEAQVGGCRTGGQVRGEAVAVGALVDEATLFRAGRSGLADGSGRTRVSPLARWMPEETGWEGVHRAATIAIYINELGRIYFRTRKSKQGLQTSKTRDLVSDAETILTDAP